MRRRTLAVVALLYLGAWIATPSGQEPAPTTARVVEGEILVKFRPQASSAAITLVSITVNEGGRGKRADIQGAAIGTDDRSFQLRAEKGAQTRERVYAITYRATDASGNSKDVTANVVVPGQR
jgi:hypothetical protein